MAGLPPKRRPILHISAASDDRQREKGKKERRGRRETEAAKREAIKRGKEDESMAQGQTRGEGENQRYGMGPKTVL